MIQSIYTSVSNADIVPCGKKGKPIRSEPIPLLRDNYLGEYRTSLEKAKVRKNLGIADEYSLLWGNIDGTIEEQKDLVQYIEQKWEYKSDLVEGINTVKEAIDYSIYFISQYEANTEEIAELSQQLQNLKESVNSIQQNLSDDIQQNSQNITKLQESISSINESITEINESIQNIDVDKNILNWVQQSLKNSKTVELKDDNTLEVILSTKEDNAIQLLTETQEQEEGEPIVTTLPGIYAKNLEPKVNEIEEQVKSNSETLEHISTYQTSLPDETTSSVLQGTTVEQLKGKPFNEIIDTLLFPTFVRDLVYPQLYYSIVSQIVEVGTTNLKPVLTFIKNDAGNETSRTEIVNDTPTDEFTSYDQVGTYIHKGIVNYDAGEYLFDNKGEQTDKRVEAGSLKATAQVIATYPWYAGNSMLVQKQDLVPFNQPSGTKQISLSGKAIIKLPGGNSQLTSFKVDGGLGYLDVDLDSWDTSTEYISGEIYKVWTKQDEYSSSLPHQVNFTLSQ